MKYTEEQAIQMFKDLIEPNMSKVDYVSRSCEAIETYEFTNHEFRDRLDYMFKKPKFEVGKVYKDDSNSMMYMITGLNKNNGPLGYGFIAGEWVEEDGQAWASGDYVDVEATEEEWKEALIKEAKRRGYKEGVRIKGGWFEGERVIGEEGWSELGISYLNLGARGIMRNGEWANIIEEPKEEIVIKLKQLTGQEYITLNGVKYYPENK